MPAISLVVCVYKQRDLLERLLKNAKGCYDELVVVHDGPEEDSNSEWRMADGEGSQKPTRDARLDSKSSHSRAQEEKLPARGYKESACPQTPSPASDKVLVPSHRYPEMAVDFSIPEEAAKAAHFWKERTGASRPGSLHELVVKYGGRFFEGTRSFTHEPHWPFAWYACKNDWILLLDADEFPSAPLKKWLAAFGSSSDSLEEVSGYTCIWPLWNGNRTPSTKWPDGRLFMINRCRVRYFGMGESRPFPDTSFIALPMVLHHQPIRKSYGYRNLILRPISYKWRKMIALSLLKTPLDLPRWRWTSSEWPQPFRRIREHPLRYSIECLLICPRFGLKALLKNKMWSVLYSFPGSHWHHALICWDFLLLKARSHRRLAHGNGLSALSPQ